MAAPVRRVPSVNLRKAGLFLGALFASIGLGVLLWRLPASPPERRLPALPDLAGKNDMLRSLLLEADREARDTGSVAALGKLARSYHANLFFGEAASCYSLTEEREPNNPLWPYLHAAALQSLGISDGVAALLGRAIALDGKNIPALLRLAELHLKLEQGEEARADFERILALAPNNPFAHVGRARVAMAAGEWEAARRDLRQAVGADARFGLAYRLLAAVEEQLGHKEAAAKATATAGLRGQVREFPDPHVRALDDLCHDVPYLLAREVTRSTNPRYNGEWRVDLLRRIVRCAPDNAEARMYLGQALNDPATMAEAGLHLQEAVRLDPQLEGARCLLGDWLVANQRIAEAEEHFNAALHVNPSSHRAPLMLAMLRLEQGRSQEAVELLGRALAHSDSLRVPTVKRYVETLVGLGRKPEAVAFVNQLVARYPGTGCLWEYLAQAAIQEGSWERGVEILRQGLAAAPYNAIIAERLAWILATSPVATPESGAEAIEWAQVALETGDPDEPTSHPLAALAAGYARVGRFDEAIAAVQGALAVARSRGDGQATRDLSEQLGRYTARQPFTTR